MPSLAATSATTSSHLVRGDSVRFPQRCAHRGPCRGHVQDACGRRSAQTACAGHETTRRVPTPSARSRSHHDESARADARTNPRAFQPLSSDARPTSGWPTARGNVARQRAKHKSDALTVALSECRARRTGVRPRAGEWTPNRSLSMVPRATPLRRTCAAATARMLVGCAPPPSSPCSRRPRSWSRCPPPAPPPGPAVRRPPPPRRSPRRSRSRDPDRERERRSLSAARRTSPPRTIPPRGPSPSRPRADRCA